MLNSIITSKNLCWIIVSSFLTPFITTLEKYVYDDWEFLKFLLILMVMDTVFGFMKYWKLKRISSTAFGKVLFKIIVYFSVLIVTHIITHFRVDGSPNSLFLWFDDFTCSALIVREAISILENLGVLYPNLLPSWLLTKLKEFDHKGKFNNN